MVIVMVVDSSGVLIVVVVVVVDVVDVSLLDRGASLSSNLRYIIRIRIVVDVDLLYHI